MTTNQTAEAPATIVARAATTRRAAITTADNARSAGLAEAARAFVDAVRPIVDRREMTVAQVAAVCGMDRAYLYSLLRQYPIIEEEATDAR